MNRRSDGPYADTLRDARMSAAPSTQPVEPSATADLTLAELQRVIRRMYHHKDETRGIDGTFMWFLAEVGELAAALRNGTHEERMGEFADVLAWLTTIANVAGVDLTRAVGTKYAKGCPGCRQFVCECPSTGKP